MEDYGLVVAVLRTQPQLQEGRLAKHLYMCIGYIVSFPVFESSCNNETRATLVCICTCPSISDCKVKIEINGCGL